MALSILGMGWALPRTEITDDFLHKELGLEHDLEWARARLGIHRRMSVLSKDYILKTKNKEPALAVLNAVSNNQTPLTLGVEAARGALEQAKLKPGAVGWVIASNDTPFETVPSTASRIAQAIEAGPGPHCDINGACSSFALHMKILSEARPERLPEFVLCVQTSAFTTRVDYSPKSVDGYIFGDGAAAQVLSARHAGRLSVEPLIFQSAAEHAGAITLESFGHFEQDGLAVREFSIRKSCEMLDEISRVKGLYAEETYVALHQANAVMQDSVLGHLKLPPERQIRNAPQQGNTAAAGCPSAIAQSLDKLRPKDKIAYAIVGAGLAWGGGLLEVQ